jgi:hypothetical protein
VYPLTRYIGCSCRAVVSDWHITPGHFSGACRFAVIQHQSVIL